MPGQQLRARKPSFPPPTQGVKVLLIPTDEAHDRHGFSPRSLAEVRPDNSASRSWYQLRDAFPPLSSHACGVLLLSAHSRGAVCRKPVIRTPG